jgi:hypothetical protein
MNIELIKKIEEQAKNYAWDQLMFLPTDEYSYKEQFQKRFVELIIEESAHVLLAWKDEPFPFDENLAVHLIREHFGVPA